jgi:hypothetical protein
MSRAINQAIEYHWAAGQYEQLPALAVLPTKYELVVNIKTAKELGFLYPIQCSY